MKTLLFTTTIVCAGMLLAGCPELDSLIEDAIPGLTGVAVLKGNIFEDVDDDNLESLKFLHPDMLVKALGQEKSAYSDLSEGLLVKVTNLSLDFQRQDGQVIGGNPETYYTYLDANGDYELRVELPVGLYTVRASARSDRGVEIYSWSGDVEIAGGAETLLEVKFRLKLRMSFRWQIQGLPGLYPIEYGSAKITSRDADGTWRQRWINYNSCYLCGDYRTGSELWFYDDLPVNFNGNGAVLFVKDKDGNQFAAKLPDIGFDAYTAIDGEFSFDYEESDDVGAAIVDISFDHEWYVYHRELNEYFASIQDAVFALYRGGHIEIGSGIYAGFYVPRYYSIYVTGQGPDMTMIEDTNPEQPWAIHVEPPYSTCGFTWWTEPDKFLGLTDLTVYNGPDKPNATELDAAILVENTYVQLQMDNVLVESANSCVAVTNNSTVDINHCVLFGNSPHPQNGLSLIGEFGVGKGGGPLPAEPEVRNTIIFGNSTAFASDGPLNFHHNCLYYQSIWECNYSGWEPDSATLVFEHPMPMAGTVWVLDPASPCIGTADDGTDIGLIYGD